MPNGHLLLYDNGWQMSHATRPPACHAAPNEEFSRVVEYALDLERGTATFVRHHSLGHGTLVLSSINYQGLVVPMVNDSWLISWGFSVKPNFNNPPDTTATEYNPTTNQELLSLTIRRGAVGRRATIAARTLWDLRRWSSRPNRWRQPGRKARTPPSSPSARVTRRRWWWPSANR